MLSCLIFGFACKEEKVMITSARKISLYHKTDRLAEITDELMIRKILNAMSNAVPDTSKDYFKSFYFLTVEDNQGHTWRVSAQGNRYAFKGNYYMCSGDIDLVKVFDRSVP